MTCKICESIDKYEHMVFRGMTDREICKEFRVKLGTLVMHKERCNPTTDQNLLERNTLSLSQGSHPNDIESTNTDILTVYRDLIRQLNEPLMSLETRELMVKTLIDVTLVDTYKQLMSGVDISVKPPLLTILMRLCLSPLCRPSSEQSDTLSISWLGDE